MHPESLLRSFASALDPDEKVPLDSYVQCALYAAGAGWDNTLEEIVDSAQDQGIELSELVCAAGSSLMAQALLSCRATTFILVLAIFEEAGLRCSLQKPDRTTGMTPLHWAALQGSASGILAALVLVPDAAETWHLIPGGPHNLTPKQMMVRRRQLLQCTADSVVGCPILGHVLTQRTGIIYEEEHKGFSAPQERMSEQTGSITVPWTPSVRSFFALACLCLFFSDIFRQSWGPMLVVAHALAMAAAIQVLAGLLASDWYSNRREEVQRLRQNLKAAQAQPIYPFAGSSTHGKFLASQLPFIDHAAFMFVVFTLSLTVQDRMIIYLSLTPMALPLVTLTVGAALRHWLCTLGFGTASQYVTAFCSLFMNTAWLLLPDITAAGQMAFFRPCAPQSWAWHVLSSAFSASVLSISRAALLPLPLSVSLGIRAVEIAISISRKALHEPGGRELGAGQCWAFSLPGEIAGLAVYMCARLAVERQSILAGSSNLAVYGRAVKHD